VTLNTIRSCDEDDTETYSTIIHIYNTTPSNVTLLAHCPCV